jgi:predicted nuclease of predicted toxin-antitoxin system
VKVLLDENFPLGLVRVLRADGLEVDHIITLAWRGASDTRIRQRLTDSELIFLTQDEDFLSGEAVAATIVVSRVRQVRTLAERIQVWRTAVQTLVSMDRTTRLFELTDDGALVPWSTSSRGL